MTARETGVSEVDGRAENGEEGRIFFLSFFLILCVAVPLARSSLSITVDEKKKGTACSLMNHLYFRLGTATLSSLPPDVNTVHFGEKTLLLSPP